MTNECHNDVDDITCKTEKHVDADGMNTTDSSLDRQFLCHDRSRE